MMSDDHSRKPLPLFRFGIFILVILLAGLLVYHLSGPSDHSPANWNGLIAVGILTILLLLSRNLWIPPAYRKSALAYPSLTGFCSLAGLAILLYNKIEPLLDPLHIGHIEPGAFNAGVIVLLLTGLFLLSLKGPWTADDFPGLITDRSSAAAMHGLNLLTEALQKDLEKIRSGWGWQNMKFTAIDAEFEINEHNRRKKKIGDLLNAIRKNRRSIFFQVLGDPGAGKTVALVKLAERLLTEAKSSGRVPLYVNLNEWELTADEIRRASDRALQLKEFIKRQFEAKLSLSVLKEGDAPFLFHTLYNRGKFFFVLDSFDEIPLLFSAAEAEAPIKELSEAISELVETNRGNRYLVASRLFRRPAKNPARDTVLEIRPFSDDKIRETLLNAEFSETKVEELYAEQPGMIPFIANPFNMTLFIYYVKKQVEQEWPSKVHQLYDFFFDEVFKEEHALITQKKLSPDILKAYCGQIATFIYQHGSGLLVTKEKLWQRFSHDEIDPVLQVLQKLKIGQSFEPGLFRFAHRRFNEYWVCQSALADPHILTRQAIPDNTRDRDVWILYCETVWEEQKISDIVKWSWAYIHPYVQKELALSVKEHVQALNCLGFLRDAFLNNRAAIKDYRKELSLFLSKQIKSPDLIIKMAAAQASALLGGKKMDDLIMIALQTNNPILHEAAFKTGKTSLKCGRRLEKVLCGYLIGIDLFEMLRRRNELKFTLKLFPSLRRVYAFYRLISLDNYIFLLGCLCLAFNLKSLVILFLAWLLRPLSDIGLQKMERRKHFPSRGLMNRANDYIIRLYNLHLAHMWKVSVDFDEVYYSRKGIYTLFVRIFLPLSALALPLSLDFHFTGFSLYFLYAGVILTTPILYGVLLFRSSLFSKKLGQYAFISTAYLAIVVSLLSLVPDDFFVQKRWRLITLLSCLGIAVAWWIGTRITQYFQDRRLYKKAKKTMDPTISHTKIALTRKGIERYFKDFHYLTYRFKYTRLLEDAHIRVSGNWTGNISPYNGSDKASQRLMELDIKWRGETDK